MLGRVLRRAADWAYPPKTTAAFAVIFSNEIRHRATPEKNAFLFSIRGKHYREAGLEGSIDLYGGQAKGDESPFDMIRRETTEEICEGVPETHEIRGQVAEIINDVRDSDFTLVQRERFFPDTSIKGQRDWTSDMVKVYGMQLHQVDMEKLQNLAQQADKIRKDLPENVRGKQEIGSSLVMTGPEVKAAFERGTMNMSFGHSERGLRKVLAHMGLSPRLVRGLVNAAA